MVNMLYANLKKALHQKVVKALFHISEETLGRMSMGEICDLNCEIEEAHDLVDLDEAPDKNENEMDLHERLDHAGWRVAHRGDIWSALYLMNQRLLGIEMSLDALVTPCSICQTPLPRDRDYAYCSQDCAMRAAAEHEGSQDLDETLSEGEDLETKAKNS